MRATDLNLIEGFDTRVDAGRAFHLSSRRSSLPLHRAGRIIPSSPREAGSASDMMAFDYFNEIQEERQMALPDLEQACCPTC